MGVPQPFAGACRKTGRVSWRTVPALIVGVLATLAAALAVLCRGPARASSAATDRIVRWWAAAWLHAAGARVVVHGLEYVRPGTAYIVVSNHQSNLDPMVHLQVLPPGLRVLAKREMFRIWLLGPAMRAIGMIEVDRDSPDFGQIDQAAARSLAAGRPLLVYPEGTTSPDGTIGQFKEGAFIIAVTSQAPVLPEPPPRALPGASQQRSRLMSRLPGTSRPSAVIPACPG